VCEEKHLTPPTLLEMAGFEVTLIGRFWVTPEGVERRGDVALAIESDYDDAPVLVNASVWHGVA
jgi:hypothetical protein